MNPQEKKKRIKQFDLLNKFAVHLLSIRSDQSINLKYKSLCSL